MSEQAPPPEDTPTVDTPQGTDTTDQQAAEQNFEQRYKEAQAWGTRLAQEKAQLEQQAQLVNALQSDDPDLRKQAFEALGLELADEPADDTQYTDPSEQLASRLEALEQRYQQQAQESQQAQQIALIEQHVDQQLAQLDGLSDRTRKWIVNTAVAMPPTADGMPDIKGAYEEWVADMAEEKKSWANTKRAPHISAVGEAGTQQPDISTREGKTDWILNQMQAEET